MTQNEWRKFSVKERREMAKAISQKITIRTYDDTGSHDTTRRSTKREQRILENIVVAAFSAYAYREDGNIDSILDMAEFTLMQFIPDANTYDSVYIPIREATQTGLWEVE